MQHNGSNPLISLVLKHSLNMFRLQKLTLARNWNGCGAGAAMASRTVFFLIFIKGWSGLETPLTCRQGDFAEDPSEEGNQAQTSGTS
jgi:hypothetical protein